MASKGGVPGLDILMFGASLPTPNTPGALPLARARCHCRVRGVVRVAGGHFAAVRGWQKCCRVLLFVNIVGCSKTRNMMQVGEKQE